MEVNRGAGSRLVQAWLTTAAIDGLWACVLSVLYGSTVTRIWQGVAATLLGKRAFDGGAATALIGLAMHFGVALTWCAVFLIATMSSASLRRILESWSGTVGVAAVYGPFIWAFMSLLVIPALTHRPPAITIRWWIQLLGHIPFVGMPIVASIARKPRTAVASAVLS